MKLLTYKLNNDDREHLGVMCKLEPRRFYPLEQFGFRFHDMNDFIEQVTREEMSMLEQEASTGNHECVDYDKVIHCAPIPHPKQDIICLGMNYMEQVPGLFFKKGE